MHRFQDGGARQHKVGTVAADTRLLFAAFAAKIEQTLDDVLALSMLHPEPVDPGAVVAFQPKVHAGQRGDGARRADDIGFAAVEGFAQRIGVGKDCQPPGDIGHHGVEPASVAATIGFGETLGQGDDADGQRNPVARFRHQAAGVERLAAPAARR